jgi:hypothetical protein
MDRLPHNIPQCTSHPVILKTKLLLYIYMLSLQYGHMRGTLWGVPGGTVSAVLPCYYRLLTFMEQNSEP